MSQTELSELFINLRRRGIRLSGARSVLLTVLAGADKPLAVVSILKAPLIKKAQVDRATVYRALAFFEAAGILEVLRLDGNDRLYHLNLHHHHHLICTACRQIEAVAAGNCLQAEIKKIKDDTGFQTQRHVLDFYGLCKKCALKKKN